MVQKDTIKCPKCKYTLKGNSKFCFYCGNPIDQFEVKTKLKTKKPKN